MLPLLTGKLTHDTLAQTMPFYCCWLCDAEDDTKPCTSSVVAGSAFYSVRSVGFVVGKEKVWQN